MRPGRIIWNAWLRGRGQADRLERGVDAALRQLHDRPHGVDRPPPSTTSVAPNVCGQLELLRVEVDGDDPLGAGELGALHDVQADAAGPDHGDGRTRPDPRAELNTAPTPVITAQPSSAPRCSGSSSGTFTMPLRCTSISSANPPIPDIWATDSIATPDSGGSVGAHGQRPAVLAQARVPERALAARVAEDTTDIRRRGRRARTRSRSSPTACTMPAASWPRSAGNFVGNLPSMTCRSLWHRPHADGLDAAPRQGPVT